MVYRESRAKRNGVPLALQYLTMNRRGGGLESKQMHFHEYIELLFGISGTATVLTGSRRVELSAGDLVIIHSNEPHDVVSSVPCCYHVVKFLPEVLLTGEQSYSEYAYVLMLLDNLPNKQLLFGREELTETELPTLFSRLREEWEGQAFGYELSLRADVTKIFLYILRRWRDQNPDWVGGFIPEAQRELMQNAISYVRAHYAELTEEETAEACGVSASYLSRSFKKCMKTAFSAYVNSVRLREGERLLLTTNDTVTEIAQAVGFSTSAYFIAKFREGHGIPPYHYRKLLRGE